MGFPVKIFSKLWKVLLLLLILYLASPLIMHALNMMGPNIINNICIIIVIIIFYKMLGVRFKLRTLELTSTQNHSFRRLVLKVVLWFPIVFFTGWMTGETVNLSVSQYYVWSPPDFNKDDLPKKIYNGRSLEDIEVDSIGEFKELVTLNHTQYAYARDCKDCETDEREIFKIAHVQDSSCDGIEDKELIGDYIRDDVDIFHILSPNYVGPLIENPRTGISRPSKINICVQFERIDKMPDDVYSLRALLREEEDIGNVVLSRLTYGMIPSNRWILEKNDIDLNDDDIVPFKYCIEKRISNIRNKFASFITGVRIKKTIEYECQANNISDPSSSVLTHNLI